MHVKVAVLVFQFKSATDLISNWLFFKHSYCLDLYVRNTESLSTNLYLAKGSRELTYLTYSSFGNEKNMMSSLILLVLVIQLKQN